MKTPSPAPDPDSRTVTSGGPSARCSAGSGLQAGTRLGKYEIRRILGRGGMGTVYEAVDTVLARRVALKVLPEEVVGDAKALSRFVSEARLAAQLNHPNVVTVYDVAKIGSTCFITMELVDGPSGQDILDQQGPMDFAQATRFITDACVALGVAHTAGMTHRDIKPGNMLRPKTAA